MSNVLINRSILILRKNKRRGQNWKYKVIYQNYRHLPKHSLVFAKNDRMNSKIFFVLVNKRMIWFIIISVVISISRASSLIPIASNFVGLRDWGRGLPYVNLVRQARVWGSPAAPWDANATFDPTSGWPTSDFGMVIVTGSVDLGGKYLFYAKGNAKIEAVGSSPAYITNQTYDASSNTMTAFVNVPQGTTQMMLGFTNTTGPGLQDIALLQPGYNLTSKSDITKLMLAHLSRFSIIRFMDWTDTNSNFESNWNDTTSINWPQYTPPRRNPWQTIPFIANQVNKSIDVWINIPHNASDDYITNVARIMLNELNPTNNIYVEYSNEVWNWGFPQSRANLHAANDSVVNHGDPYHFNYDNCSNPGYWAWRRIAYQIKHISDLFKTVFGDENVGPWKRVRPILAGQIAFPFVIRNGLEYLDTVHGPPSTFLHGMAGAPYFNLGKYGTWTNLTVDQVIDALNMSIQEMLPERGWSQEEPLGAHGVYATWYNLAMHGYEGGADTVGACGNCSLDAKINATRDPRMTDICVTYLNGWSRFGFQPLNWYTSGAGSTSKYGSWALLEDMRQEILIDTTTMFNSTSPVAQLPRPSPKLKAIDEVRQHSVQFNFGIPIPASNISATNFVEHQVPYPYPYVSPVAQNATFYYPLLIHQSPIRIGITVYLSGFEGILEGGINNEQFVRVQTPTTANWTTFEAAPVMYFNINQSTVPSIVALRLKNVQRPYAFAIRSFDVTVSTD